MYCCTWVTRVKKTHHPQGIPMVSGEVLFSFDSLCHVRMRSGLQPVNLLAGERFRLNVAQGNCELDIESVAVSHETKVLDPAIVVGFVREQPGTERARSGRVEVRTRRE